MPAQTGVDPAIAAALGFSKPECTAVERERRWLCDHVPRDLIRESVTIIDLYVAGTRLRLRDMRPSDGGPPRLRLTRKADVDHCTRLLSSIYLPEAEFVVLANALHGVRLTKIRHRLHARSGVPVSVDEFQGELAGLVLAEAEFATDDALSAFASPEFTLREVTDDPRYTGAWLALHGRPS